MKSVLGSIVVFLRRLPYRGWGRFCPICEHESRRFRKAGLIPRADARCVYTGSLERHRLVWLYFQRRTNLFSRMPLRVLHVAPEPCLEAKLKSRLGAGYQTADLADPHVMEKMDVTNISYPDECFDVIYCSHVLEHVPDDRKAMRKFYRILKEGGWAILLVPIMAKATFEDPAIVDPARRLKIFGQSDHVRIYGPDYVDRLREAGFSVQISKVDDVVERGDAIRMGLTDASGDIYFCAK